MVENCPIYGWAFMEASCPGGKVQGFAFDGNQFQVGRRRSTWISPAIQTVEYTQYQNLAAGGKSDYRGSYP